MLITAHLLLLIAISNAQWISPSKPTLPREDTRMAIGSYNDSIFIIGGDTYMYQLVEYKIAANAVIDYGNESLSEITYGYTQYYVQLENIVFMVSGNKLKIYDLETHTLTPDWYGILLPVNVGSYGCPAATNEYLWVIGGQSISNGQEALNTVQMLDLVTKQWINNIPSMNDKRLGHSCIIYSETNFLYAIGGQRGNAAAGYVTKIEKINVNNIQTQSWSYIGSLTTSCSHSRAVSYNNMIWVIGGQYWDGTSHYLSIVHIINTITGAVTVADPLPYALSRTAAIVVNNVLYAFGGVNPNVGYLNSWIKYEFPTPSPTNKPSNMPTIDPTNVPTISSISPTKLITNDPSCTPTSYPAKNPTFDPTGEPTNDPTTYAPSTYNPTTIGPTPAPTITYKYLHLIWYYNDNRVYIMQFLTLINYANIMHNVMLSSLESISLQSVNYEESINNGLTKWKRAGIFDFVICNIFDTQLLNNHIECPLYSMDNSDNDNKSQYIAIGIFGVVVDDELNEYKKWLIQQIESDDFKNEFTENMNNKLTDIISNRRMRRMLLEYHSFEAIKINVIDPNNIISTINNNYDSQGSNKIDLGTTTMIIVVVVSLLIGIMIITLLIYFKKIKAKNKKIKKDTIEIEGYHHNGHHIEMNEQRNEMEGINNNNDEHNVVNIINETNDIANNDNDDIIKAINQTSQIENAQMYDNNNNNGNDNDDDIINAIHQTPWMENDYNAYNQNGFQQHVIEENHVLNT